MAVTVRNTPKAVEDSVCVVRAFVKLRELVRRLDELEEKAKALATSHDTFSRNTHHQLKQVFGTLRELTTPPDPPKWPIGFATHEDKGNKAQGSAGSKT